MTAAAGCHLHGQYVSGYHEREAWCQNGSISMLEQKARLKHCAHSRSTILGVNLRKGQGCWCQLGSGWATGTRRYGCWAESVRGTDRLAASRQRRTQMLTKGECIYHEVLRACRYLHQAREALRNTRCACQASCIACGRGAVSVRAHQCLSSMRRQFTTEVWSLHEGGPSRIQPIYFQSSSSGQHRRYTASL